MAKSRMFVRSTMFAVCLLTLAISGCRHDGSVKLVPVSGLVKFQGAPVAGADVKLVYPSKDVAWGVTDSDGRFTLYTDYRPGAPVGHAKVSIRATSSPYPGVSITENINPREMESIVKQHAVQKEGGKAPGPTELLPSKYANPDTSGLEVDVPAAGVDDMEFNLSD